MLSGIRTKPQRSFSSSTTLISPSLPLYRRLKRCFSTRSSVLRSTKKLIQLNEDDISHFKNILGDTGIITNKDDLTFYNSDWMNKYHGDSSIVLRPKNTEEVSQILSYCNSKRIAVVPQGGNTGLVGGSVPVNDEIIISMHRMNQIRNFDPSNGVLECDAGCILQDLDHYLDHYGHMMPIDLGAKGSCHIGGNVATNAGGIRFLRYGSLHGNIRDVEVVLPEGRILRNGCGGEHGSMNTLDKDNTGYHLKNLFIGSEGSLGIITGVSIKTAIQPNSKLVSLLALNDFESLCNVFHRAKYDLGETLSAFEFFDYDSVSVVKKQMSSSIRYPLDSEQHYPFHALLEVSGSNASHNEEKLNQFLETIMEDGQVVDGTIAQDESQATEIWRLRESITEALSHSGTVFKYDVSLPIPRMYDLVSNVRRYIQEKADPYDVWKNSTVVGFGHLGDGNLHLNISCPLSSRGDHHRNNQHDHDLDYETVEQDIERFIFSQVNGYGGSISAEHGIGQMKATALQQGRKSRTAIHVMKEIKNLFDPQGIMNPYKILA